MALFASEGSCSSELPPRSRGSCPPSPSVLPSSGRSSYPRRSWRRRSSIAGEMIPDGSDGRPDAPANRALERVRFLVPREVFDGCSTFDRDEGKFGWVRRIEGRMRFLAWLWRWGAQQRVRVDVGVLRRPG